MKLENLKSILGGNLKLMKNIDVNEVAKFEDRVQVIPKDVCNMLEKFLTKKISAKELSEWAKFVTVRGEYCSPREDGRDDDYYEKMWDIISWLSTPEIDGEIDVESVNKYLLVLKKYEN